MPMGGFKVAVDGLMSLFGLDARDRYYFWASVSGIPGVGSYLGAIDSVRYMDDYMSRRGLSYSDILYPTRTTGYQGVSHASSGTVGSVSFVSSNIKKLYR